jgi:hypothetical protein
MKKGVISIIIFVIILFLPVLAKSENYYISFDFQVGNPQAIVETKDPFGLKLSVVDLLAAPIIKNGKILISVRDFCEMVGGIVSWNQKTKSAEIIFQENTSGEFMMIVSKRGSDVIKIDGRMFVPIRFMAQALGAKEIIYISETNSVIVTWSLGLD